MNENRNYTKATLLAVLLAFTVSLTGTAAAAFSCDSGSLSTTCTISSEKTIGDGESITGTGSIVLERDGLLYNAQNRAEFTINIEGNFTMKNGSKIRGNPGINAQNIRIQRTAVINATGLGYEGGLGDQNGDGTGHGPGGGTGNGGCCDAGSGAGHGNVGGDVLRYPQGGPKYGNYFSPTTFGSGGGGGGSYDDNFGGSGGDGGGKVQINADQTTKLEGTIAVNAEEGEKYVPAADEPDGGHNGGGGGSGGSVYLQTDSIYGNGKILAEGGDGGNNSQDGGGGAGGRISIDHISHISTKINVSVKGGTSPGEPGMQPEDTARGGDVPLREEDGGAGTIYPIELICSEVGSGNCVINNSVEVGEVETDKNLILREDAVIGTAHILNLDVSNLKIGENSSIDVKGLDNNKSKFYTDNITLNGTLKANVRSKSNILNAENIFLHENSNLIGNFNISATKLEMSPQSVINASFVGHRPPGSGPGGGNTKNDFGDNGGGGAGHGGIGESSSNFFKVNGGIYGSIKNPTTFGSAGGKGSGEGGYGGGRLILDIAETANLSGELLANGESGSYNGGGAGSGGSVNVEAEKILGQGRIEAEGGKGNDGFRDGGSGAGGRIALDGNISEWGGSYSVKSGEPYGESVGSGSIWPANLVCKSGTLNSTCKTNKRFRTDMIEGSGNLTLLPDSIIRGPEDNPNETLEINIDNIDILGGKIQANVNITGDNLDITTDKEKIGEAGTFTTSNGEWQNVSFDGNYENPVVVGTTKTKNVDESAVMFQAKNVQSGWAEMRLCESEGGAGSSCDLHITESGSYMVVDKAITDQIPGVEAGKIEINQSIGSKQENIGFKDKLETSPSVVASTQTSNGVQPVSARITSTSRSGFELGICYQDSTNGCKDDHVEETVGWIALEKGRLVNSEVGTDQTEDDNWVTRNLEHRYSNTPVVVSSVMTRNGDDDSIIEIKQVSEDSFDFRLCELDDNDECDGHHDEKISFIAMESGNLSVISRKGQISAKGTGYAPESGPGAGETSYGHASGGGHGGHGGYASTQDGGSFYGDFAQPTSFGSGGGQIDDYTGDRGGAGGGRIHIDLSSELVLNGTLSADGESGPNMVGNDPGGGAGGSILLESPNTHGTGKITAEGGAGGGLSGKDEDGSDGGGGAGGRIALNTVLSDNINVSVAGGRAGLAGDGAYGTIYPEEEFCDIGDLNSGCIVNSTKRITSSAIKSISGENLTVRNNGAIRSAHNLTLDFTHLTVEESANITAGKNLELFSFDLENLGETTAEFGKKLIFREEELKLENPSSEFTNNNYKDIDEIDGDTEVELSVKVYRNRQNPIDSVWVAVDGPNGNQQTFQLESSKSKTETQIWSKSVNIQNQLSGDEGTYNVNFHANSTLEDGTLIREDKEYSSKFFIQNITSTLNTQQTVDPGGKTEISGTVSLSPTGNAVEDEEIVIGFGSERANFEWSRETRLERDLLEAMKPSLGGVASADLDSDGQDEVIKPATVISGSNHGFHVYYWDKSAGVWERNQSLEPPNSLFNTLDPNQRFASTGDIDQDENLELLLTRNVYSQKIYEYSEGEWSPDIRAGYGLKTPDDFEGSADIFDIGGDGNYDALGSSRDNTFGNPMTYNGTQWVQNDSLHDGLPDKGRLFNQIGLSDFDGNGHANLLMLPNTLEFESWEWHDGKWRSASYLIKGLPDLGTQDYPDFQTGEFDNDGRKELIVNEGQAFEWSQPVTNSAGRWKYNLTMPEQAGTYGLNVNTTNSNGIFGEITREVNVRLPISDLQADFLETDSSRINVEAENHTANLSAFIGNSSDSDVDSAWVEVTSPSGTTKTFEMDSSKSLDQSQRWNYTLNLSSEFNVQIGTYNVSFHAETSRGIGSEEAETQLNVESVSITEEVDDSRVNTGEEVKINGTAILNPYHEPIASNPVNLEISNESWSRTIVESGTATWSNLTSVNKIRGALNYEWYDTSTDNDAQSSAELDDYFSGNPQGTGLYHRSIDWQSGTNSKPDYLPEDKFAWKVKGYIHAPEDGEYTFKAAGNNFHDIILNGNNIASNSYGENGTSRVNLTRGWHNFQARMQEGTGSDSFRVYWSTPSNSTAKLIPEKFFGMEGVDRDVTSSVKYIPQRSSEVYLRGLDYELNEGSIDVTVQSDPDEDGIFEENSSEIKLDGSESFLVEGLENKSRRFRLKIDTNYSLAAEIPILREVELIGGEVTGSGEPVKFNRTVRGGLFFEGIEDGLDDWEGSNYYRYTNESYEGFYSIGTDNEGKIDAEISPEGWEGGRKPKSLTYYWWETENQGGHWVDFIGPGGRVIRSGTDNPQWDLVDGSGSVGDLDRAWYKDWVRYRFDFDWENCEYTYDFDDTEDRDSADGTRKLDSCKGIETIKLSRGDSNRFDNFKADLKDTRTSRVLSSAWRFIPRESDLELRKVDVDAPAGSVEIEVASDPDNDGEFEEFSNPINYDGSSSYDVTGLETESTRFGFRFNFDNVREPQVVNSLNLYNTEAPAGKYLREFKAPTEPGNYTIKVNTTDENDIYGENSTTLSVFNLSASVEPDRQRHVFRDESARQNRLYDIKFNDTTLSDPENPQFLDLVESSYSVPSGWSEGYSDPSLGSLGPGESASNNPEFEIGEGAELGPHIINTTSETANDDIFGNASTKVYVWSESEPEIINQDVKSPIPRNYTHWQVYSEVYDSINGSSLEGINTTFTLLDDSNLETIETQTVKSNASGIATYNWSLRDYGVGTYFVRAETQDMPEKYINTSGGFSETNSFEVAGVFNLERNRVFTDSIYRDDSASGSTATDLQAKFSNSLGNLVENATVTWEMPDGNISAETNDQGVANYYGYNPNQTVEPDNYSINVYVNKENYEPFQYNTSLEIRGELNATNDFDETIVTRGLAPGLNSTVLDENNESRDANVTWLINGTEVARGEDSTDRIDNISIGEHNLTVKAEKQHFDSDTDQKPVTVYGLGEVADLYPSNSTILPDTTINVTANISDANTSQPVGNIPVNFTINGTQRTTVKTNASGIAGFSWDPAPGVYDLKASVTGNESLKYNISKNVMSSRVEVDRELYIDDVNRSSVEVYRIGGFTPDSTQVSVRLMRSSDQDEPIPASNRDVLMTLNGSDRFSCTTDAEGYCSVDLSPTLDSVPGTDELKIETNSSQFQNDVHYTTLDVKGVFQEYDISTPSDSSTVVRGEQVPAEFELRNYNGVDLSPDVAWNFAGRSLDIEGTTGSFRVGVDEALGSQALTAEAQAPYYYDQADSDSVNLQVFGKSYVSLEGPSNDDKINYGDTPQVYCSVQDQTGGGISGYPVEFFQNDTVIAETQTDFRGDAVAEWDVPDKLANFSIGCRIDDNSTLNYKTYKNESSQVYETKDEVPPNVEDLSLSETELRPGDSLEINYTASDQVGINRTYIQIVDPFYEEFNVSVEENEGVFETTYTTDGSARGTYEVRAIAVDENGNRRVVTDSFTTSKAGDVSVSPASYTASNITLTSGENYTTTAEFTARQDVSDAELKVNISQDDKEYGIFDWNSTVKTCGDLSAGESCERDFELTVTKDVPPQTAFVPFQGRWTNASSGNTSSVRQVQTVEIARNPVMNITPSSKFVDGVEPSNLTATNENITFEIENVGNYQLNELDVSMNSSEISDRKLRYYNRRIDSIPAGGSEDSRTRESTVELETSYGMGPGNFSGVLNFTTENDHREVPVKYRFDEYRDFSREPLNEDVTAIREQEQDIGTLQLRSLSNVDIDIQTRQTAATNITGLGSSLDETVSLSPLEAFNHTVKTDRKGIEDLGLYRLRYGLQTAQETDGQQTGEVYSTFDINVVDLKSEVYSNTDTEDIDITSSGSDTIRFAVAEGDNIRTEDLNFSLKLVNESRGIEEQVSINSEKVSGDGNFTLSYPLPEAPDARIYDLVLTVEEQNYGVELDKVIEEKYNYVDVTPPEFKSEQVDNVFLEDDKINLNISVTDNNLEDIRSVSYRVEYPDSTRIFDLNRTNGYWQGSIPNPGQTGDFEGTLKATDAAYNNNTESEYFRVGEKELFTGRFEDAGGDLLTADVELKDPDTGEHIRDIDITDSNAGNYSAEVLSGRYDVEVETQGNRITLRDAEITGEDPLKIDELTGSEAPAPATKGKVMGIAVKQNTEPSSGRILFNYTEYRDNIPDDESISDINIGRCKNFNYTDVSCEGRWKKLDRNSYSTNVNSKTVTAEVPGFSIYTLYFPEETNEELQEVRETVEEVSQSVGGISGNLSEISEGEGGSGSGSSGLNLGSNSISASIKPGETQRASLLLQNGNDEQKDYEFGVSDAISQFVTVPEDKELEPGQSEEAIIEVSAPADETPSSYSGYMTIEGDDSQRQVPMNIEITPPDSELLDLSIDPVFDSIQPGEEAQIEATLNNQGYTRNVDVTLGLEVVNPDTNETVASRETTLAVSTTLTRVINVQIPDDAPLNNYEVRGTARYSNLDVPQVATSVATVEVNKPLWSRTFLGVTYGTIALGFVAVLITSISASGIYYYHRKKVLEKKRYMEQIDLDTIPSGGQRSGYVGQLAEMGTRTFLNLDDLTTHALIAGATGSGKTVTGQVVVEEALKEGVNVIVLDPTAQWSGYLRECNEDEMVRLYSEFGMSKSDARAFNGNIRAVEPEQPEIDITEYLENDSDEGEIIVFSMHKLDNENLDKFVDSTIQQVFDANLPERNHLETMIVYDEAHRILEKFGGSGEGLDQMERGAREFRKWGVGMILLSQVVSDFPGEVRANVGTTIQMRTQYEGDLDRLKDKFGMDTVQSVAKAEVGSGMVQNSDYNHGRPYFVNFRPMLHSPHRLSDEQLDKYEDYNRKLDELEARIDELEEQGEDVYEYRNQLKLSKKNLRKGSFNLVDIYTEELEDSLP